MSEDSGEVWLVTTAAIAGFVAAAALGRGPISPAEVWVPNRILAALSLPASGALALILQRRRIEARRSAEASQRASDLNRLLLSLMAHDLRSGLAMALQCLDYVGGAGPLDLDLVGDARTRLRRGLGALDGILSVARQESGDLRAPEPARSGIELARELAAEVSAFEREATARDKVLGVQIEGCDDLYEADGLVLRQTVAILVDNAVRHACPGRITVTGRIEGGEVRLEVADQGPGLGPDPEVTEPGSGLGLALCRALVHRAGGDLRVIRDAPDGTTFALRLPLGRAGAPGPPQAG
jgi:signal transduction histidine kinase